MVKNLPADAEDTRDTGSIPGSGRSPRGGNGNPLQYSCLENSTYKGARQATVHGVAKELDTTEQLSTHKLKIQVICTTYCIHITLNKRNTLSDVLTVSILHLEFFPYEKEKLWREWHRIKVRGMDFCSSQTQVWLFRILTC